ncbi:MAG: HAD-IA family hydrolase [bacterium]|nr:HAD-IA family hydrolase [bacterium]
MMNEKKRLKDIEVISFDVGFTLIYTEPPVGEMYAGMAARFGYSFNGEDIQTRFLETWTKQNALNREKRAGNALADEELSYEWWKGIFKESVGDLLPAGDLEKMFKVCFEEYAKGDYWRLFPDVEQTLTALRAGGFRLVVLSNWDHRLNQTLNELGLDRFFEKIYISTLIGHAKPDPGAFHHMIEDLKVPAEVILHVGDTLEEDIYGARQAGVRAVCIDRKKRYQSMRKQVPIITNLTELLGNV